MKKLQHYNIVSISLVTLFIVFLCFYLRLGAGHFSVSDYLWAEDGTIFINQALQSGIFSFVQSYADYLHLYPRIFALIAKYVGLEATPYILFAGWILAFLLMSGIIMNRIFALGLESWVGFIIIALIALQPHNGESFFTITNAQWFLGVALAVYILVDPQKKPRSCFEIPLLIVLCLTGPFSLLLLPALLIKVVVFKDFKHNANAYKTVIICAMLQIFIIFYRANLFSVINELPFNVIINHWVYSLIIFFSFGGGGLVKIMALVFWATTIYIFAYSFFIPDRQLAHNKKVALIILFTAMLNLFAAVSRIDSPLSFHPIGRYYVIPYALSFFAIAIVGYYFKWARMVLIITIGLICFIQFQPFLREPLQFSAFAQFARYKNDLHIPINPNPWVWHIDTRGYNIPLQQISKQSLLQPYHNSSQVVLGVISCPESQYVGIEIKLWRDKAGIVQLFWGLDEQFTEKNSLQRFYLDGLVNAQFAFENIGDQMVLRLDQIDWAGKEINIKKVDIYCLP